MRLPLALAGLLVGLCLGARVAFWHIPKTAGTSLSAAYFRALGISETRPYMIENEDDCAEAIDRVMDMPEDSFVHVHHKDFSFATALHRKGVKVGLIMCVVVAEWLLTLMMMMMMQASVRRLGTNEAGCRLAYF